jgi:hypothetical protein
MFVSNPNVPISRLLQAHFYVYFAQPIMPSTNESIVCARLIIIKLVIINFFLFFPP